MVPGPSIELRGHGKRAKQAVDVGVAIAVAEESPEK